MTALSIVNENIEIEVKVIKTNLNKKRKNKQSIWNFTDEIIKKMKTKLIKKLFSTVFAFYFLLVQIPVNTAMAVEPPSAPTAPSAPTPPAQAPDAPTPPPQPESNTSAPTPPPSAPTAPTLEEAVEEANTATLPADEEEEEESVESEETSSDNNESTSTNSDTNNALAADNNNESGTGGQVQNGSGSGATINTGNSTNTAVVATDANSNLSAGASGDGGTGATIINSGNGSDSTNSGSATISDNNNTNQINSANVENNLSQTTTTGENRAANNTNGDNTITTGDANTSGTAITSVNTNLEGLAVYEFNIAEDQNGDYVLDFANATCVSGCSGDTKIANTGNGSDSTNTADLDSTVNNNTFQQNDAVVENNMTLTSNSGDNVASRNTGGDNTITTGDANVSANAVTLANNNISGGVVYAVVNIYGSLVGDIILPDGTVIPCCFGGETTVENSGNGSDSTNTANVNQTENNTTNQFNTADIANNLYLYANTVDNHVTPNTTGNNTVETGEAGVVANVVNFVNNNISGGNWWLVIVNEGGKWIGRILGAPDGSNMHGSEGFAITTDENGEVTVSNSGNGSGSENTANLNQTTNNTTNQINNAQIVNNMTLSANSGGNDASRNTGGNNNIQTGDANIIANIVNFVNNNIVGTGHLLVTVVNVFGEWLGNFVGPGQVAENSTANQALGGQSSNEENNVEELAEESDDSNSDSQNSLVLNSNKKKYQSIGGSGNSGVTTQVAGVNITSEGDSESELLAFASGEELIKPQTAGKKVLRINLAWLTLLLPIGALYIVRKRKLALAQNNSSALKGK